MTPDRLKIYRKPKLNRPRLVLGLAGWMDGGDASTGAIKYLRDKLKAEAFAHIEPEGFYIYNFPAPMEISAFFRPHTQIKEGIILTYNPPASTFYCSEANDLVLFGGKEPNLGWQQYADCIFALCKELGISQIFFIGSVAGLTPHTREPRITCSLSDEKLKDLLTHPGIRFTNYEGPASIITYLTTRAPDEGVTMLNLIAEIPAYVQGYNPRAIETVIKTLGRLLDLQLNLDDLREMGDEFERRLSEIVQDQADLAKKISDLEADYDNEVFDTEMGDLKDWLHQKGIRLD